MDNIKILLKTAQKKGNTEKKERASTKMPNPIFMMGTEYIREHSKSRVFQQPLYTLFLSHCSTNHYTSLRGRTINLRDVKRIYAHIPIGHIPIGLFSVCIGYRKLAKKLTEGENQLLRY